MKELDLRYDLKSILREREMTQLDLAKQLKLKPNNLNTRLARGRNCQLSLLEDICQTLNVEMEQLLYGTDAQSNVITKQKPEEDDNKMYQLKLEESQKKLIAALEEISNLKDELLKKEVPARKTSNDN